MFVAIGRTIINVGVLCIIAAPLIIEFAFGFYYLMGMKIEEVSTLTSGAFLMVYRAISGVIDTSAYF